MELCPIMLLTAVAPLPATAAAEAGAEETWVDGLRHGQPASFDAVFAAYRGRVFGYLARMTGRRDLAEDLTQEVFLRLARAARGLRSDTRLRAWLFTVAHNVLVSHARAAKATATLAAELAERPISTGRTPYETLAATLTQLKVEAALAALPAGYREVVLLVAIEGMPAADVGAALSLTPAAVRQRLSRARGILSQALAEEGGRHDG
ncbi:MAG: sigma-70 family RNA polymerase sigma factor [Kofleriaceae bacterium]|nr:sigma-70 family RNA polymerase sigma factor [Kofleriaceae bacterium]